MWKKVKVIWQKFRKEKEDTGLHLNQSDKREIWYGAFIICMATAAICTLVTAISTIRVNRENSEDMEGGVEMIAAYLGSATQDEYEEIAETLRNDLVISEYGQKIENYIRYIPNTAETCRICVADFPSQLYLVCTNTGQLYELDLFEKGNDPGASECSGTRMSFGYDEVSESSLYITKMPGNKKGSVTIHRERGIVSIQRMKALFCDECIREMLDVLENQSVEEFVIFSAEGKRFYPVGDGKVEIGDYMLQIRFDEGDYEIAIEYVRK